MQLSDLDFLASPSGERWLDTLAANPPTSKNQLKWATRLRRELSAEKTHALLETALLRQKAATKFSRAGAMFFTRDGLEMSSAEAISQYRARRFHDLGAETVLDGCCGIGGDAIGLNAVARVIALDIDPLHAAMAARNATAYRSPHSFHARTADVCTVSEGLADAAFFDPGRRTEQGRRIHTVYSYRPPLDDVLRWRSATPHVGVKISPGVAYDELPDSAETEFISVDGDLREAVLWFGGLHSGVKRRATVLTTAGHAIATVDTLTPDRVSAEPVPVVTPRAFLLEPDPAVIRAHLVQNVARQLGAAQIDRSIAYLTTSTPQITPFVRSFAVDAWFPFQLKRLRHALRARGIGTVTIKKRGSPLDPDQLQRQLRLRGTQSAVLFLTRVRGEPVVIICRMLHPPVPGERTQ